MNRTSLLIVDDHAVVAEGLVRLLGSRFDIVDTITDGRLAVAAVSRLEPDIVLLDMSMPHVSGLEVMRRLKQHGVTFKAIVLTMHADPQLAVEALKAGASGYVLKESSGEELLQALEVVASGGKYLATALTKEIVTLLVGVAEPSRLELTAVQCEVLRLLIQGQRAKEIAATLQMSTRAVQLVKSRIMQLLNVHSTAELVRYTIEHHLVKF
jgi:DNA-binding NarL/FixJ family response regulator